MSSRYVVNRVAFAVFTIVATVLLMFILFRMMPGSPDRVAKNPNMTQAQQAALREKWGLDKPLIPDQLVSYVESTLSGDLGYSYKFRAQPVAQVIGEAMWPTVLLLGLGELIAMVVGLVLGAISGWRRGSRVDRVGNGVSLVLYAMPYFVIGMPLIMLFATALHLLPTSGMSTPGAPSDLFDTLTDVGAHLILPLTAVSLGLIGGYSILMRSSIIETRAEDYITTARAKGLTDRRILWSHAFPNALLPMVTWIAISFGYVIAGAITLEIVFNWPGIGTLTVEALDARDYPLLQGIFLLLAVSVVVANLIADLVYGLLDPRVRA
ncbi:MAG: ABC transporter permease [Candidatus Limnocylindrales bacterium]